MMTFKCVKMIQKLSKMSIASSVDSLLVKLSYKNFCIWFFPSLYMNMDMYRQKILWPIKSSEKKYIGSINCRWEHHHDLLFFISIYEHMQMYFPPITLPSYLCMFSYLSDCHYLIESINFNFQFCRQIYFAQRDPICVSASI